MNNIGSLAPQIVTHVQRSLAVFFTSTASTNDNIDWVIYMLHLAPGADRSNIIMYLW